MLESGIYDKEKISVSSIVNEVLTEKHPEDVGAILTFTGITKKWGFDGKEVESIEMESYEKHANDTIKRICKEVSEKYGAASVQIFHMVGNFKVGENLVLVIVTSKSRKEAIPALEEAINRYKTEPALWKKEIYTDGSGKWISHA